MSKSYRRKVEWVEKLEDGCKMDIRALFVGNEITWAFRRSDEDRWVHDQPATVEQWDTLEEKIHSRYVRRHAPYKDVEIVKKRRAAAGC